MAAVTSFSISVPDAALAAVRDRLESALFPDEAEMNTSWDYGVPLENIKRLTEYWHDGFDWRAAERRLNLLPQFRTAVTVAGFGDLDVHFVHHRSSRSDSIPLLFCHGWPGSFLEVSKLLPLLVRDGDGDESRPSFHVVAPSLPNFGFSSRVRGRGFGIRQYAETCHALMQRLGYVRYATQGGDWGSAITRAMGRLYPAHCLASHLNMVIAQPPGARTAPVQFRRFLLTPYSGRERAGLARTTWFEREGSGYLRLQSTRPATVGYALADSPVALLAWLYEKLHDWTDEYAWTDDEILTWISLYQLSTAGAAASVKIYYEFAHGDVDDDDASFINAWNPHTLIGCSFFPRDLVLLPLSFVRTLGPVVFVAEHDEGGHFAAFERPELLAGDLRRMFGRGGGAWTVTPKLLKRGPSEAADMT